MRIILAALLATTAILAAGCGGSGNEAATTVTTVQTVTEAGTDTSSTDTTAADTTSTDTTATATATDTTSSVGGALAVSAGCTKVAELSQQYANAIAAAGATGSSEDDIQKQAEAFKSFADQVPEEIRGAFTTIADAYAKYAAAFKDLHLKPGETPDAATIAKLVAVGKSLDSQKLQEASAAISTWAQKNCSVGG